MIFKNIKKQRDKKDAFSHWIEEAKGYIFDADRHVILMGDYDTETQAVNERCMLLENLIEYE